MTDNSIPVSCRDIQSSVNMLLDLARKDSTTPLKEISAVETSLQKATSPRFEIIFAGAFSAGKSMLINALLGQELLYSSAGHATGTECFIEYAEPNDQRVVLEFLSEKDISEQIVVLCQRLEIEGISKFEKLEGIEALVQRCQEIIHQEGGESKSDKAKQANALKLLIQGYYDNQDRIRPLENATYSMEQLNLSNLREASGYARRGSNSAVLKKIEYYYHHSLLKDDNIIIDTPGIDAPVERDRQLTYDKILSPDTSAVVCVLKAASTGEIGDQETKLLEIIRSSSAIRDRVFYVFNCIDEVWYDSQLKKKFDEIQPQFKEVKKYETSALLGFHGKRIEKILLEELDGFNQTLAENHLNLFFHGLSSTDETPQFVHEFNKYCSLSGKLDPRKFPVSVHNYQTQNQNFLRILSEQGKPIIDNLVEDSGVDKFSTSISRYLTEEKRPQLFANLAEDLKTLCTSLRQQYSYQSQLLKEQPIDAEGLKNLEMRKIQKSLWEIGKDFDLYINSIANQVISYQNTSFETSFRQLKLNVLKQMDSLLENFSVLNVYEGFNSYRKNATAPLLSILVESFYYLAKGLEASLAHESKTVIQEFFIHLENDISGQDFYKRLKKILGDDAGILRKLKDLEKIIVISMTDQANLECDEYIRESYHFYDILLESGLKQLVEPFIHALVDIINSSSSQPQSLLGSLRNLLGDNSSSSRLNLDVQRVVDIILGQGRGKYRLTNGGNFSLNYFQQELQPSEGDYKSVADQKYIIPRIDEKRQSISHLLEQDFGFKIYRTLRDSFRQKMNQTLKREFLYMVEEHQEVIQQQYEHARQLLEQVAAKRAEEQFENYESDKRILISNMGTYNTAVDRVNECLQGLKLSSFQLYRIENL